MIGALRRLLSTQERVDVSNTALASFKIAGGRSWLQLFSTHPPLEVRIAALESASRTRQAGGLETNVDEAERAQHLKTLTETPARLKAALKGVSKKLAAARPAPGKWSILEIVCHMRDMEREAYLARYRRILAEDNPPLPDIDGDTIALERDYRAQSLAAVLRDWSKLRKESLKLLKKVKGGQWERVGTHETAGRLTRRRLPAPSRRGQRRGAPRPDRGDQAPLRGPGPAGRRARRRWPRP